MSIVSNTITKSQAIELLAEIVQLLYNNKAYFCNCGGALKPSTGLTQEQLLTALQSVDDAWTNELLTIILKFGSKMGTLRQQRVTRDLNEPVLCLLNVMASPEYYLNCNMLNENIANNVFSNIVPNLPQKSLQVQHPFPKY